MLVIANTDNWKNEPKSRWNISCYTILDYKMFSEVKQNFCIKKYIYITQLCCTIKKTLYIIIWKYYKCYIIVSLTYFLKCKEGICTFSSWLLKAFCEFCCTTAPIIKVILSEALNT